MGDNMPWLKLTLLTGADKVDPLVDLLEAFSALSTSLDQVSEEQLFGGIGGDPVFWRDTSVSALFDRETDVDILLACLRNRIGTENIHGHRIEFLDDQEWSEVYKEGVNPLLFAGRLLVTPSWIAPEPGHPCALILDPGLAFGTGTHQTTSLCLEWLAARDLGGRVVIDYGCGSGILALAAARLGADHVYAVDIDPQAVQATSDNARRNGLEDRLSTGLPGDIELPKADLLVANILLNPLIELAPKFCQSISDQGQLLLSGILAVQVEPCQEAYAKWFEFLEPCYGNEWALLQGIRRDLVG